MLYKTPTTDSVVSQKLVA